MIVVTGGSGYIGSYIVKQLVAQGESVRVMVNSLERARQEGRLAGLPVDMVQGDVTKPATLAPVMQGADAVIHTVAIAIEKGGRTYEEINYQGTVNVVDAAKAAGVRRFLNMCQLGADSSLPNDRDHPRREASSGASPCSVVLSRLSSLSGSSGQNRPDLRCRGPCSASHVARRAASRRASSSGSSRSLVGMVDKA